MKKEEIEEIEPIADNKGCMFVNRDHFNMENRLGRLYRNQEKIYKLLKDVHLIVNGHLSILSREE